MLFSRTVASMGLLIATAGAALLYWNGPLYMGRGQMPVLKPGEAEDFFPRQERELATRQKLARLGFLLLAVGSALQLVAVWL